MSVPTIRFDDGSVVRKLRRGLFGIAVLAAVVLIACVTVSRVDAAHVGIRVKLAGSSRGVQDIPVVTGWVFYNPLTEQIIEFPTSVQNVVWTKSPHEGTPHDESISFSSAEGVNVNADIGLSFHIEGKMAPHIYLRFRQPDLQQLANGYIRNAVREAFNSVASKMPVQDIYGTGKTKLVHEVVRELGELLGKDGFVIDQITINGALRLPANVADAINSAMEATQKSIQAENRVRQVKAEAEQAIAEAHGAAEASRERAHGEADALLIRAKSEAKANTIIRLSTTGAVLQYRALEKWNGRLPTLNQGPLPMLTFDLTKGALGGDAEKKLAQLLEEGEETGADKTAKTGPTAHESAAPPAPAAPPASAAH